MDSTTVQLTAKFDLKAFSRSESGQFKFLVFNNTPAINGVRECITLNYDEAAKSGKLIALKWKFNPITRQFPASAALNVHCMLMQTNEDGLRGWERIGCAHILLSSLFQDEKATASFLFPVPYRNVALDRGTLTCTLIKDGMQNDKFTFATPQPLEIVPRQIRSLEQWADATVTRHAWLYDNTACADEYLRRLHSYYYHMGLFPFMPGYINLLYEPTESLGEDFFERALRYVLDRWEGATGVKVDFAKYALMPKSQEQYTIAQRVLAEVLVTFSIMSGYLDDQYYDSNGQLQYFDSWFPAALSLTADCEDFARQIEITSSKLLHLERVTSEGVKALQLLSRRFVVCQVLCTARAAKTGESATTGHAEPMSGHYTAMMLPCSVVAEMLKTGRQPMSELAKRGGSYQAKEVDFSEEVSVMLQMLESNSEKKGNEYREEILELEGTGYTDPMQSGTITQTVEKTALPPDARIKYLIRRHLAATHKNAQMLTRMFAEQENGSFFCGYTVSMLTTRFWKECKFESERVPFELAFFKLPTDAKDALVYGVRTFDLFKRNTNGMFCWPSYLVNKQDIQQGERLVLEEPPIPSFASTTNSWVTLLAPLPLSLPSTGKGKACDFYMHADHYQQHPAALGEMLATLLSAQLTYGYHIELQPLGLQSRLRVRLFVSDSLKEIERISNNPLPLDQDQQQRLRLTRTTENTKAQVRFDEEEEEIKSSSIKQPFEINEPWITLETALDALRVTRSPLAVALHANELSATWIPTGNQENEEALLRQEYQSILDEKQIFSVCAAMTNPAFDEVMQVVKEVCARWPTVFAQLYVVGDCIVLNRHGVPLAVRAAIAEIWDHFFPGVCSIYCIQDNSLYFAESTSSYVKITGTLGCAMFVSSRNRFFNALQYMQYLEKDQVDSKYGICSSPSLADYRNENRDVSYWVRVRDLNPNYAGLLNPWTKVYRVPVATDDFKRLCSQILTLDIERECERYMNWYDCTPHQLRMWATNVWINTFPSASLCTDVQHTSLFSGGINIRTVPPRMNVPEAVAKKVCQFWDWVFPKCYNVIDCEKHQWHSAVVLGSFCCFTKVVANGRALNLPWSQTSLESKTFIDVSVAPDSYYSCSVLAALEEKVQLEFNCGFQIPSVLVEQEQKFAIQPTSTLGAHVRKLDVTVTPLISVDLTVAKAISNALFVDLKFAQSQISVSRQGEIFCVNSIDAVAVAQDVRQRVGYALIRRLPNLAHRYDLINKTYAPPFITGNLVGGLPWILTLDGAEMGSAIIDQLKGHYEVENTGPKADTRKRTANEMEGDVASTKGEKSARIEKEDENKKKKINLVRPSEVLVIPDDDEGEDDSPIFTSLKPPKSLQDVYDQFGPLDFAQNQSDEADENVAVERETEEEDIDSDGEETTEVEFKRRQSDFDEDIPSNQEEYDERVRPAAPSNRRGRLGWSRRRIEIKKCHDWFDNATTALAAMEKRISVDHDWKTVVSNLLPKWSAEAKVPEIEQCFRFVHLSSHCLETVVWPAFRLIWDSAAKTTPALLLTTLKDLLKLAARIYAQAYVQVWRQIRMVTGLDKDDLPNANAVRAVIATLSAKRVTKLYKLTPKDQRHNAEPSQELFNLFFNDLVTDGVVEIRSEPAVRTVKLMNEWLLESTQFAIWVSRKSSSDIVKFLRTGNIDDLKGQTFASISDLPKLIGSSPSTFAEIALGVTALNNALQLKPYLRALNRQRLAKQSDQKKQPLSENIIQLLRDPKDAKDMTFSRLIHKFVVAGPLRQLKALIPKYETALFWTEPPRITSEKMRQLREQFLDEFESKGLLVPDGDNDDFVEATTKLLEKKPGKSRGGSSFYSGNLWLEQFRTYIETIMGFERVARFKREVDALGKQQETVHTNRENLQKDLAVLRKEWVLIDQIAHQVSHWRYVIDPDAEDQTYEQWRKNSINLPYSRTWTAFFQEREMLTFVSRLIETSTWEIALVFKTALQCLIQVSKLENTAPSARTLSWWSDALEFGRSRDFPKRPISPEFTLEERNSFPQFIAVRPDTLPSLGPRWRERIMGRSTTHIPQEFGPDFLKRALDLAFSSCVDTIGDKKRLIEVETLVDFGDESRSVKRVRLLWTGKGTPSIGLNTHVRRILDHVMPGVRLHVKNSQDVMNYELVRADDRNYILATEDPDYLHNGIASMDTEEKKTDKETKQRYFSPIVYDDEKQSLYWTFFQTQVLSKWSTIRAKQTTSLLTDDLYPAVSIDAGDITQIVDHTAMWRSTALLATSNDLDLHELGVFARKRVEQDEAFISE